MTITDLPPTARLILMIGPNGCGKSSIFDAFKVWHQQKGGGDAGLDNVYHLKNGLPPVSWDVAADIQFHEEMPTGSGAHKKIFYVRSAYRNEPDFTSKNINRLVNILDAPKVRKLIEDDRTVSNNYQHIVGATIESVYGGKKDELSVKDLRKECIGQVRASMSRVFADLLLSSLGNPLHGGGAFFFEKGATVDFHYKNLSGGEKAAFDLLLDLIVKRDVYDNTVFCIDEPETHMHTSLQGALLEELFSLIPDTSQLWLATHSIGMMRQALSLQEGHGDQVVFLDFHEQDFDKTVILRPAKTSRLFWQRTLQVAVGDLAALVAPRRVVLCEGSPHAGRSGGSKGFDAECYSTIFSEYYPDTAFLSVGNASDVEKDRLVVGKAIQTIVPGTTVVRLIDRDDRSDQDVARSAQDGVRVLLRRNLESYLMDDEVLSALCVLCKKPEKIDEVLNEKKEAMKEASRSRKAALDDVKAASGQIHVATKRILDLTRCGNDCRSFMRDSLAPLIIPETKVYRELERDVFGTGTNSSTSKG